MLETSGSMEVEALDVSGGIPAESSAVLLADEDPARAGGGGGGGGGIVDASLTVQAVEVSDGILNTMVQLEVEHMVGVAVARDFRAAETVRARESL